MVIIVPSNRCWFGKEPGKYMDYIYQGPVILVLLVSSNTVTSFSETQFSPDVYYNESFSASAELVGGTNLVLLLLLLIMKREQRVSRVCSQQEIVF